MAWKSSKQLLGPQMNRRGLGEAIAAGMVCQEAERLYPGLFKAVSLKRGVLHLSIARADRLRLRLVEGKILGDCAAFAKPRSLPVPTRIRLTFQEETAIV